MSCNFLITFSLLQVMFILSYLKLKFKEIKPELCIVFFVSTKNDMLLTHKH